MDRHLITYWKQVPLLRLLFPFMQGIVCCIFFPLHGLLLAVVVALGLCAAGSWMAVRYSSYRYRYIPGALISLFFFLLGCFVTVAWSDRNDRIHFHGQKDAEWLEVRLLTPLKKGKSMTYRGSAEVLAVKGLQKWRPAAGKILLSFRKGVLPEGLKYGDCFLVRNTSKEVPPPSNPYEFNYKRYLEGKGIYDIAYIGSDDFIYLHINRGSPLVRFAFRIRDSLLELFREKLPDRESFSVASALVLGYTDDLDPELVSAFTHSGTLHVLSVSGMHVALIYYVLSLLLFFLGRNTSGRWVKMLVLIVCLWIYVFVTGFAPATLRAGVMISILVIGQSLDRRTNVFNTLAASAFVLLLYNPHYIADVGFQLSYLALSGILLLQPVLYRSIYLKYWLPDQAWKLIATSIAAQLYTFPLSFFYFGQFPAYFILSNLVVIPLSTVSIYSGLAVLSTSYVPMLNAWSGKACSFCISLLDLSVKLFDRLPFSYLSDFYISAWSTFLIYLIILAFTGLCFRKNLAILKTLLLLIILYAGFTAFAGRQEQVRKALVVYSTGNTTCIDLIAGKESILLIDTVQKNKAFALSVAGRNWSHAGITGHTMLDIASSQRNRYMKKRGSYFQFCSKRVLLIGKSSLMDSITAGAMLDYIIIRQGAAINLQKALSAYKVGKVIADGSCRGKALETIKSVCQGRAVELYSVAERGAYVEEL